MEFLLHSPCPGPPGATCSHTGHLGTQMCSSTGIMLGWGKAGQGTSCCCWWSLAHSWLLGTVSEPAGLWWHSLPSGASKRASLGSPALVCSLWAAAGHGACPHRAVSPQQCHCQHNLPRALAAPPGHCMGRGSCSGLCGPRPGTLMIFVGPFQCRALPDFNSRAVPPWLLVAPSSLPAPAPAPMAQAGCGGRRGVSWGQSWVQAGHRRAWGRAGMGREAPGLGRAGSRAGDDVWADVSDRTR